MKKYLIAIALMFPLVTFAQTDTSTADLQALIKQLQTQIQLLQSQIVDLQAQVQSVKIELNFSRVLAQGAAGDDVIQLQEFLKNFTGSYPNGSVTGYFGPLTQAAVKKFQTQNGIEPVGIVGPITQNKLNVLATAIPSTPAVSALGTVIPTAPISIASTGLTLQLASNNPTAGALVSSAARVPVLAVNFTAGNGDAMTVSKLRFHEKGVPLDSLISDAYLIENDIVLYKKYSSISGGVIEFSGLSLSVVPGQTRTIWLVIDISSDFSAGNTVSFGLNAANDVAAWDASNNSVVVSGSFPVIGNIFGATSASNLPPVTPAIPATPTTPCINCLTTVPFTPTVIKVLSPNGGEQWQIGGTYTIKYSAEKLAGNKALLIYLQKGYDAPTTKTGVNSSLLIGATTNLESYTYTVPQIIQSWPGLGNNYTIRIYGEGAYDPNNANSYVGDESDALFSIAAGSAQAPAPTTPRIPVTTTSGGGYGAVAAPMPIPTPTLNPTMLTTQDKIANIQAQISALQNQLNTTTDDATRASLKAQIAALQTVVQELQNQIFQGQLLPTSTPAPISTTSIPTTTPQATPTTQDQIAALSKQVSALQNQLNITTDDATRTSLMTQIVALNAQIKALQNTLIAPQSSGSTTAAPTVQVVPSVVVLSPNGGETLTVGKMYEIKWTGGNSAVDVYLLDNQTRLGKKIFSGIANNNYVSWVAAPLSSSELYNEINGTFVTPSGQYVMWVGCTDNNCTVDDSDSYFKIVGQ